MRTLRAKNRVCWIAVFLSSFAPLATDQPTLSASTGVLAQQDSIVAHNQQRTADEEPPFNLTAKTLGGVEFWADEQIQRGWRIQRNVIAGHCRLLDTENVRRAWGSLEQCQKALNTVAQQQAWPRSDGRVILVLHGLGSFRGRMQHVIEALSGMPNTEVYGVSYPSLMSDVDDHAAQLARVLSGFSDAQEINFVGHSLGNIVVRRLLALQMENHPQGKHDERIKRIVMIAPPNHGSSRAAAWAENPLFKSVIGETGQQLGAKWNDLAKQLATPQCEFGIIAGARGDGNGWNANIPGDDDGTISVETTKLPGASDFVTVPVFHTLSESNDKVLAYTAKFIEHGFFVSANARQPIESTEEKIINDKN
ncbi:MAG: alpha/beta hydrolase [Pirellulales bacterium]|nr:alpha/beta hydrolase [Pirellulales bacterium]